MAEKWKTEYHVKPKGGSDEDWLDSKDEAISRADYLASEQGTPYVVEKVTSYYDDREEIYETEVDTDDEDD